MDHTPSHTLPERGTWKDCQGKRLYEAAFQAMQRNSLLRRPRPLSGTCPTGRAKGHCPTGELSMKIAWCNPTASATVLDRLLHRSNSR